MKRIFLLAYVLLLVYSCQKKTLPYNLLIMREDKIDVINGVRFDGRVKNSLEDGNWTILDKNKELLQRGQFTNGFKTGRWLYNVKGQSNINISWKKSTSKNGDLMLSIPSEWEAVETEHATYAAKFKTISTFEENKYFAVLVQDKAKIGVNLDKYFKDYDSVIYNTYEVLKLARFKIDNGSTFYYARYIVEHGEEEMLINTFIGENDNLIYDCTYIALNDTPIKKKLIFLEIVRSLNVRGDRFFTPFKEIKSFESISL